MIVKRLSDHFFFISPTILKLAIEKKIDEAIANVVSTFVAPGVYF